ncbi:hypothetical protein [Nonomuraea sp. NPDC049758]|uniref:hypothetical protein n=1 Tax=Nonomuraea sp. NPDC049758 TaxID=3154360 RepID=UPI00341BF900
MNALIRAALVGAVVGLAQAVIAFHGPEDAAGNLLLMLFATLPAGMLLSWYAMLRNWWLVALLGQFALVALYVGLTMTAPFPVLVGFGSWRVGLITMAAGACGYAVGAGLALPLATPLRVSAVGVAASLRATATVLVDVLPETMSPEQACDDAVDLQEDMTCVEAAPDLWILRSDHGSTVFTAYENTLVRLSSGTVHEKQLLAAARSLRPVGLWELAAPAYERP